MKILHIDSSANSVEESYSRKLSAHIVARLQSTHTGATVIYRDVAIDQLPHVDNSIREAWMPARAPDTDIDAVAARSKQLVDELKSADVVVIGAPMYNFSVPSTLKAWIDHVAIAGQTFQYTEAGPKGLLNGKVYLAMSSGGVYSKGPAEQMNYLGPYLTNVMQFLGMEQVHSIYAEGVAYGPEHAAEALTAAMSTVDALIK